MRLSDAFFSWEIQHGDTEGTEFTWRNADFPDRLLQREGVNETAHELELTHHQGMNSACPDATPSRVRIESIR